MKREDIEKAAAEYCATEKGINKIPYKHGFRDGADWRMNSVWHKTDEMPKNNKMFLCITETYSPLIGGPDNADYKETFKALGVTKWAYVEDLLPDYAE